MPITLVRKRIRPSTPPSLVKFAARAASVSDRALELDPDQRPTSRRRCTPRRRSVIGTPTTAEAVSCEPTAMTGVPP